MKIGLLEAKIKELECTSTMNLANQADTFLHRGGGLTLSGPDTYEHFCGFSVNKVIQKLQERRPEVYAHFMQLGDVQTNTSDDGVNKLKAISSLCTLLNAQSNKAKELLMSMMLIGRSVGKQVHVYT